MDTKYMAHKITVTHDLRFQVVFEDGDAQKFDSAAQAKAAIAAAVKLGSLQVNLAVVTAEGDDAVIEGINRTSNQVKGSGFKTHSYGQGTTGLYPPIDWVRRALAERQQRMAEIERLNEVLGPVSISMSCGYGRLGIEDLPDKLEELSREYAEALSKAQKEPVDVVALLRGMEAGDSA